MFTTGNLENYHKNYITITIKLIVTTSCNVNKGIFKTVRITLGDGKFPMFLKGKFLFVSKGKRLCNLSSVLRPGPLIKDHCRDCPDRPTVIPSSIIPMQHRRVYHSHE